MTDEELAMFKVMEERAVDREIVDRKAEAIARNAHRFQVITLKVGPQAGKALIWLECSCEHPESTRCEAVLYN